MVQLKLTDNIKQVKAQFLQSKKSRCFPTGICKRQIKPRTIQPKNIKLG